MIQQSTQPATAISGFNLYTYRNAFGAITFQIAAIDAMPAKYLQIVFTGDYDEVSRRLNEKIMSN